MSDTNDDEALNYLVSGKLFSLKAAMPALFGSIILKPFLRPIYREFRHEHRLFYDRYLNRKQPDGHDSTFDAVLMH